MTVSFRALWAMLVRTAQCPPWLYPRYRRRSSVVRAIGYREPGDIGRDDALTDIELPMPEPTGRDILVQVRAVSVNPVDTKVRKSSKPEPEEWKVLGWDAAGVVSAVGF